MSEDMKRHAKTLEELNSDPDFVQKLKAFSEAAKAAQNFSAIRIKRFLGRFTETSVFVKDMIEYRKAVEEVAVEAKVRAMRQVLKDDISDIMPHMEDEQLAREFSRISSQIEVDIRKKVKRYDLWLINQSIVTLCTILDAFFDEAVDAALKKNPHLLYNKQNSKQISLKEVIELETSKQVSDHIRQKEVSSFSSQGLGKKLEYMKTKLGLTPSEICNWSYFNSEVQIELETWNLDTLREIYKNRNDIVHRDEKPYQTVDELCDIAHFFMRISLSTTFFLCKKFGISIDFELDEHTNE